MSGRSALSLMSDLHRFTEVRVRPCEANTTTTTRRTETKVRSRHRRRHTASVIHWEFVSHLKLPSRGNIFFFCMKPLLRPPAHRHGQQPQATTCRRPGSMRRRRRRGLWRRNALLAAESNTSGGFKLTKKWRGTSIEQLLNAASG